MIRRPNECRLDDETLEPPRPSRLPSECPACYGAHIPTCVKCGVVNPGSCVEEYPEYRGHCSVCVYEMRRAAESAAEAA